MAAAVASSPSPSPAERRGIPAAPFVEDVQVFLEKTASDASSALVSLQDRLQQYKVAEMKLLAQRRDLQAKIPDIKKCLDIVEALLSKKSSGEEPMTVDFELAEGIYSQARVDDGDSVCLWLGANVMLEYSYDEALLLLKKNLENANSSLEAIIEDLKFIRDQVTVTEVTIARVYNWDVHNRRKSKQQKDDP
ncbi:hypothetical protein SELMODRAFT_234719 [Selaginella moellendorffii]|uniref:Prefoldin subunit 3 n=1 Tax=Selaginella moellendorffii TaxID=88036 RepID=D8SPE1_SELML|nr:probable prefoldin subunit 3 [Selaginella moellendorffii]EFJ13649.1 hypothetical protein SELMODRAFT_234719 [Selaginella moellendorffii]|eukprot:XP_002985155.1 probable prefoldin subunit 3 [Selaginella moellendorffii]